MLRHLLLGLLVIAVFESIACRDDDYEESSYEDEDYEPPTRKPRRKMYYYALIPVNRHNYNKIMPVDMVSYRNGQTLNQCLDLFEKCFKSKEGYKHNEGKIDWDCRATKGCEEFTTCADDMIEEKSTDCAPEIGDACVRKLTEFSKKFRPCFVQQLAKQFPGCDVGKKTEKAAKKQFRSIRTSCKTTALK